MTHPIMHRCDILISKLKTDVILHYYKAAKPETVLKGNRSELCGNVID